MKGIIFDLDGTMIDNMMVHHRAWQQKLGEIGMPMEMDEVMEKVHGINEEILERLFGQRFSIDERRKISWEKEEMYRKIFLPELRLVGGLEEFLEAACAEKIPLGIGTAAPPENMNFVLDNLGIRHMFSATLNAADVPSGKGKPDPAIFIKVAERLNIPPEKCLIFEDTPVGALAASRAGSRVIVVTTTHYEHEFSEIPNIIRFIRDYHQLDALSLLEEAIP